MYDDDHDDDDDDVRNTNTGLIGNNMINTLYRKSFFPLDVCVCVFVCVFLFFSHLEGMFHWV